MNSDDSYLDKMYEKLSAAIMQSITSSDEIREILADLGSKDLIHESAVFNLLLSLEELDTFMNPKSFHEEVYKLEPPKPNFKPKSTLEFGYSGKDERNLVDGKKLSKRERLFEDYYRAVFSEKDWMKKARLKL